MPLAGPKDVLRGEQRSYRHGNGACRGGDDRLAFPGREALRPDSCARRQARFQEPHPASIPAASSRNLHIAPKARVEDVCRHEDGFDRTRLALGTIPRRSSHR